MTKEFCRVEVYDQGLYGIWTEGFRTNRNDLARLLNLSKLTDKNIYISMDFSMVLMDVDYVLGSDERIQEINFAVVNDSKEKTENNVEGIVKAINLYEREVSLEEEEIPNIRKKLDACFFVYRKYFASE